MTQTNRTKMGNLSQRALFKKSFFVVLFFAFLAPLPVFAQTTIKTIIEEITRLLGLVIPLLFGLAFVVFLWGMYKYISSAETGAKEEARNIIIYGIIGLFVMVTVWGLVKVLQTTFLGSTAITAPTQPKFPGQP